MGYLSRFVSDYPAEMKRTRTNKRVTLEQQIESNEYAIRVFEQRNAEGIAIGCQDSIDCAQTGLNICLKNREILLARRDGK